MGTKRLVIVDDHYLISTGLQSLLKHSVFAVEITVFNNGREALTNLEKSNKPDLILIDINMPVFSGIDLLESIISRKMKITAAMISGTTDAQLIQKCIDAGAKGFISKMTHPTMILAGINQLLNGDRYLPPHLENSIFFNRPIEKKATEARMVQTPKEDTSVREFEILNLLKVGKSNKDIAYILNISPATVKFHVSNLFRKLNARSRTECVSLALQSNILTL